MIVMLEIVVIKSVNWFGEYWLLMLVINEGNCSLRRMNVRLLS